ncbi:hypothetical protein IVA95_29030 [Bradyrhizobium sp. 157]|nr:hypothetical protein [Bradyrhizobium sp. 157]
MVLDRTTSYPASMHSLAEQTQKYGLNFIDVPVTGSPEHAEQGFLNAIVG